MRTGVISWIVGLFLVLGAGAGEAQPRPSLDRILPTIRQHHPGRFYDAEGPFRGPDGLPRYRLKWMTPGGRVIWFDADARTGRVLGPDIEMRRGPFFRPPRDYEFEERRWNYGGRWPREDRPRRGR
ncbi:MAG: hypothetical protein WDM89_19935 [Rhizomicrobium sp.]